MYLMYLEVDGFGIVKALRADRRGLNGEAIKKTGALRRCVVIRCLFMIFLPCMDEKVRGRAEDQLNKGMHHRQIRTENCGNYDYSRVLD